MGLLAKFLSTYMSKNENKARVYKGVMNYQTYQENYEGVDKGIKPKAR